MLGRFYKNNYRPSGWYIIDIFIKNTTVYCQSDIAKSPRRLFNLAENSFWNITLSKGLKPIDKTGMGGTVKDCPKCDGKYSLKTSKTCPVCRKSEGSHDHKTIEFKCSVCGYVEDFSSDDKHSFSDEPEIIVIKDKGD